MMPRIESSHPVSRSPLVYLKVLAPLALLILLLYMVLGQSKASDQEQILNILTRIREGAAREDVGETTADLSDRFKTHGINRLQVRLQLMQFFRQHQNVSVLFNAPQDFRITGDTATMLVYVEVSGLGPNGSASPGPLYKGTVRIDLEKEPTRRYFLLPDHAWRIVTADIPNAEEITGL